MNDWERIFSSFRPRFFTQIASFYLKNQMTIQNFLILRSQTILLYLSSRCCFRVIRRTGFWPAAWRGPPWCAEDVLRRPEDQRSTEKNRILYYTALILINYINYVFRTLNLKILNWWTDLLLNFQLMLNCRRFVIEPWTHVNLFDGVVRRWRHEDRFLRHAPKPADLVRVRVPHLTSQLLLSLKIKRKMFSSRDL